MKDKKIIFIMASVSQPRCLKRINSFIEKGYDVKVYGFNRGYYLLNADVQSFEIKDLGMVDNGRNYITKFFYEYIVIRKNVFAKYDNNSIYYAFSFDIALICLLNSKRYIYEISDLVYGYFNIFLIPLFSTIDRLIVKKSLITVLTSFGFVKYLFKNKKIDNTVVVTNRVNKELRRYYNSPNLFDFKKLKFGYVGAFRYQNTILRFARIIGEKYPNYEFNFYGDSPLRDQVIELSNKYKNVHYFGPFVNPNDLNDIYKNIDIVVACYDISTLNEQLAEPNKLYESLCFNKPIIVSKGTYLSERVEQFKCGYAINASTDEEIESLVSNLQVDDLIRIINNINMIEPNEIFDNDSQKLFDKMKGLK